MIVCLRSQKPTIMQFDIYRPKSRTDLYLFVPSGVNPQIYRPDVFLPFGELEFIKTREISPGQSLIGASTDEIIRNVSHSGFHIQVLKVTTQVSEGGAAIGGGILGASVGGPVGAVFGALIGLLLAEHAKKVPNEL